MKVHVIVPAAGAGTRFGAGIPKQYQRLDDQPVLQHTVNRLAAAFPDAPILVVIAAHDTWFDEVMTTSDPVRVLRCGGETRASTVRNAVLTLDSESSDDWVVVHDAVRPCLPVAAAQRLVTELAGDAVGGLLALPFGDTLKRVDESARVVATEPREHLWRAQTPQMFRLGVLRKALDRRDAQDATDEAEAVERLGLTPRVVPGSASNLKITFAEDMRLAAAILAAQALESLR